MQLKCPRCASPGEQLCLAFKPTGTPYRCTRPWWHLDAHAACGILSDGTEVHPIAEWPKHSYPWGDWMPSLVAISKPYDGVTAITLYNQHGERAAHMLFGFAEYGTWLFHIPATVKVIYL